MYGDASRAWVKPDEPGRIIPFSERLKVALAAAPVQLPKRALSDVERGILRSALLDSMTNKKVLRRA